MGAEPNVSQALEMLAGALARQEKTEPDQLPPGTDYEIDHISDRLALATALPVLKRGIEAFPSAKDRRQAKSAYRMVAAALGIEHE